MSDRQLTYKERTDAALVLHAILAIPAERRMDAVATALRAWFDLLSGRGEWPSFAVTPPSAGQEGSDG